MSLSDYFICTKWCTYLFARDASRRGVIPDGIECHKILHQPDKFSTDLLLSYHLAKHAT